MSSIFGFVVGLLQAALALVGFVQQHPELPAAQQEQAKVVAQQAISQATQALQHTAPGAKTKGISGWEAYTDTRYGFTIKYPAGLAVDTSSQQYDGQTRIVKIGATEIGIYTLSDTAHCWANGLNPGVESIHRIQFSTSDISEPATGLLGLGKNFVALHNGICFQIVAVHDGRAPGHYEGAERAQVEAENNAGLAQVLAIARTFTFTGAASPNISVPANNCDSQMNDHVQAFCVPGMSKYTDTDFGFSFWYPSGQNVQVLAANQDSEQEYGPGTIVRKTIDAPEFTIDEVYSPTTQILGDVKNDPSPVSSYFYFYFDKDAHQWMEYSDGGSCACGQMGSFPADVSKNTMGGLHILSGYTRFGIKKIIPLTAHNFLVLVAKCNDASDYGCNINAGVGSGYDKFTKSMQTILATDPAVATPVGSAEQITMIQAEKSAYAQ